MAKSCHLQRLMLLDFSLCTVTFLVSIMQQLKYKVLIKQKKGLEIAKVAGEQQSPKTEFYLPFPEVFVVVIKYCNSVDLTW